MRSNLRNISVDEAIRDIESRTLSGIPGNIAQLVYLASTRDYNTGEYHHDGLAFRFTEEVARTALGAYHRKVFLQLVYSPLEELVRQLEVYMTSSRVRPHEFLEFWKRLEPYRVTIPGGCDILAAELFFSNIRIALAILQRQQETIREE